MPPQGHRAGAYPVPTLERLPYTYPRAGWWPSRGRPKGHRVGGKGGAGVGELGIRLSRPTHVSTNNSYNEREMHRNASKRKRENGKQGSKRRKSKKRKKTHSSISTCPTYTPCHPYTYPIPNLYLTYPIPTLYPPPIYERLDVCLSNLTLTRWPTRRPPTHMAYPVPTLELRKIRCRLPYTYPTP